jgi:hypothetical protein
MLNENRVWLVRTNKRLNTIFQSRDLQEALDKLIRLNGNENNEDTYHLTYDVEEEKC